MCTEHKTYKWDISIGILQQMQNYSTNVHFPESHTLFASQSLISRVTSFITTSGNMMTCCAIQTFSTSGIAIFSIKSSFAFYSEENIQSLKKLFLSIYSNKCAAISF